LESRGNTDPASKEEEEEEEEEEEDLLRKIMLVLEKISRIVR
jgi:hypothetical protein